MNNSTNTTVSNTNRSKIENLLTDQKIILTIYLLFYLIAAISLMLMQPFGNPPDEYNRFLIPEYIATHSNLPNGYDETIRIGGYGFSYAFQPILPYIFQGYAMKIAMFFGITDKTTLLMTARGVNVLSGLLMAITVFFLSQEWFQTKRSQTFFCFLVTFLPQALFMHTYVNTDSFCMLSISVILLALTKGCRDHFSVKNCILLSIGIIICALSYYNAYGYILSSMFLFFARFVITDQNTFTFDYKNMLKKGGFVSVLVLLGISWWFIRSAILYNGDFLGLKTRNQCALLYAIPEFHPLTRTTWQNQGHSFFDMLLHSDFINLSTISFISVFGAMTVVTNIWIYRFFKLLFGVGLLCVLLPCRTYSKENSKATIASIPKRLFWFFLLNMVLCICIPCYLSAYYSYTTDFQPQGRYMLPALLPLCYFCILGYQKIVELIKQKKLATASLSKKLSTSFVVLVNLCIVIALFITIFGYAYPYYIANPIAP